MYASKTIINSICNGLDGAPNLFVSRVIPHHHQLSAWMAPKISTILDGLQQQLFLLNELVARVATLPPADDSCRQQLLQLFSGVTIHIALIQLL